MDASADHNALIGRIIASDAFKKASTRKDLLLFLYKRRDELLSAKEVECDFFRKKPTASDFDPGHARVLIGDLKKALERYTAKAKGEDFRCEVKDAKESGGYQLHFIDTRAERSATKAFWAVHDPERVIVVCGSHLFLHDPDSNCALRFYDFNEDRDNTEEILQKFEVLHPESFKANLQPWYHSYLSSGEVHAFEALQRWFLENAGVLITRLTSRETPQNKILDSSPILLGRPETNKFIKKIMDAPRTAHLGYRIHSTLGAIKIENLTDVERKALSRFPLTKDGILGPVPTWQMVFGLVTRLKNPSGYGYVTIISADSHARVVSQIVEVLTSDTLTKELLQKTHWDDNLELPESFEMIFATELSPGGLEGEGHAELLCWRPVI